jgi:hypothetical protein
MAEQSQLVLRHVMTIGASLGAKIACGPSLAELALPAGFHG